MQWSIVRQKDVSGTEGEGLQDRDQASNPMWGRNAGYNEETRKTDRQQDENATMDVRSVTQRQDQERTHPRNNNESDAAIYHGAMIEQARASVEER